MDLDARVLTAVTPLAAAGNDDDVSYGWLGDFVVQMMEVIGPVGVGVAVLLENLFPPIPSELILPLARFTASSGAFSLWEALAAATAGSLVGAVLLYGLGAWLGRRRLYKLAYRLPLVDIYDVEKSERWFLKYGYWAVFFGRMVPVIRSLISIPAGLERMKWWLFILFTFLGSLTWNTAWILGGYLAGENWYLVADYADTIANVVVAVVVVAILCWIVLRFRRNRGRARDPDFREKSPDEVVERIERLLSEGSSRDGGR